MKEIRDYKGEIKELKDYDFGEYMEAMYGIYLDDLTDDDYDRVYEEYSEWRRALK